VRSLGKFSGLLVALQEELLALLSVYLQELGVEVCALLGQRLVAPGCHVCVIKRKLHRLRVLLLPVLQLFGSWSLNGRLHLLDLVSVVGVVVQNLPLLRRTFVELLLFCADLLASNNVLDPVLHFDKHLASSRIVEEASGTAVAPLHLHLVVLVLVLRDIGRVISTQFVHGLGVMVELSPQLLERLI